MLPILETLQDGKERSMRELTDLLAERYHLTEEERQELLPSGQQSVFSNRVAWAKSHLKNAGLIDNPVRGMVRISEEGRKVLEQKPAMVNCKFLKQFPAYLKFIGQVPGHDGDQKEEVVIESTKTPLELLASSFDTLRKATAEDLLAKLKKCSPGFFEQVVVRLLHKMGYGGVDNYNDLTSVSGNYNGSITYTSDSDQRLSNEARNVSGTTVGPGRPGSSPSPCIGHRALPRRLSTVLQPLLLALRYRPCCYLQNLPRSPAGPSGCPGRTTRRWGMRPWPVSGP
jgi:restriction endonuclease Mrr